jgi:hypothetical protein
VVAVIGNIISSIYHIVLLIIKLTISKKANLENGIFFLRLTTWKEEAQVASATRANRKSIL